MTIRTSFFNGIVVLGIAAALSSCGNAQSRKAGYMQKAEKYEAAGNFDKARLDYRNALQIDPKDAVIRYHLGQIAEKTGDIRSAVGLYQSVINDSSDYVPARAALGRLYLFGGLPDKALELAETGLTSSPQSVPLLTVRGGARAQLGSVDEALEDGRTAAKLDPSDSYATALLASLLRRQGKPDEAATVVQSALERTPNNVDLRQIMADLNLQLKQPEKAEAQLRAVIALEPRVLAHRSTLARLYLQRSDKDGAEKVLRTAIEDIPDSVEAKVTLVNFLESQRGADAAQDQADKFLAQAGKDDALKLALAGYLAQAGYSDKAESVLRSVIEHAGLGPAGLTARDRLATLLVAKKDTAGAGALLNEVLKKNPHDNDALIVRAEMSIGSGDVRGAIDDLRSVLRDQPNSVPLMRMLARAYQQNSEPDQAEEMLRAAVQVAPKDFDARLALAQALGGSGKREQAAAMLEELAKEKPDNLPVETSLYQVLNEQKQYLQSLATAETIERLYPRQAIGFYLAGLVKQAMGKPDEATKDFEHALQIQPGAAEPLTALVRLDLLDKRVGAGASLVDAEITRDAKNPIAHFLKGVVLREQGKLDAAVAAFQDANQLAPAWTEPYQNLAVTLEQGGRLDDAVAALKSGIDHSQGSGALVAQLSNLYERHGRIDDAIALYDDALKKNPKSLAAMNNLAMLLANYKTDAASLQRAQKLTEQLGASTDAQLIDTRGWVKFKSGDFHGAEALLQQAVDKAPAAPELRYHLGMAQVRSGEQQAAEQNLQLAVAPARPFAGIDEARTTLAQLKKSPLG